MCGTWCIVGAYLCSHNEAFGADERSGFISIRHVTLVSYYAFISQKSTLPAPGPWFNVKMSFYQWRESHCGDSTVLRSSYLHNGISYTSKISSLYWIRPQYVISLNVTAVQKRNSDPMIHFYSAYSAMCREKYSPLRAVNTYWSKHSADIDIWLFSYFIGLLHLWLETRLHV